MVYVFIVASLVALLFVVYLFACSSRRQRVLHAGLAFILAGAMGNLYDRSMVKAHLVTLAPSNTDHPDTFIAEVVGDPDADPIFLRERGTRNPPQPYPRERIASIRTRGVVRDFIRLELALFGQPPRLLWPWVFNFADVALTLGVGILLIHYWVERGHPSMHKRAHPADPRTATKT
jgi:lipoprotein signal peptidase